MTPRDDYGWVPADEADEFMGKLEHMNRRERRALGERGRKSRATPTTPCEACGGALLGGAHEPWCMETS